MVRATSFLEGFEGMGSLDIMAPSPGRVEKRRQRSDTMDAMKRNCFWKDLQIFKSGTSFGNMRAFSRRPLPYGFHSPSSRELFSCRRNTKFSEVENMLMFLLSLRGSSLIVILN
jgi:hypothetical protein